MAVRIREAGPGDLPEIMRMIRELAEFERLADEARADPDEVAHHLFGPDPVATVALAVEDADRVVGMALWFRTFSTFLGRPGIWLEDLYVDADQRGRGVGRALLEHLRALTDGRVEWSVLAWNRQAIALYDAVGARPDPGAWISYRWSP